MAWVRAEVVVAWTPCTGRQPSPPVLGLPDPAGFGGDSGAGDFPGEVAGKPD